MDRESSIVPFIDQRQLSAGLLNLPNLLLETLDRSWLSDLNVQSAPLAAYNGSDVQSGTRFLEIDEIACSESDTIMMHLHSMQNVIGSMRDGSHALVQVIQSDGKNVRLLMGVRAFQASALKFSTADYVDVLYRALRSNFPGLTFKTRNHELIVPYSDWRSNILDPIVESKYLAGITGIPSVKDVKGSGYEVWVQGMDRLIDALRGEQYTLLVLAEPVRDLRLVNFIDRLRKLSGEIHQQVKASTTDTRSVARSRSTSRGNNESVGLTAIIGLNISESLSETIGESDTQGRSFSLELLNKNAQDCENILEHYIKRMQTGRALGFWNVGVYLASDKFNTILRAQGITRSLYSGTSTYYEPIREINFSSKPANLIEALQNLQNPALEYLSNPHAEDLNRKFDHPIGAEFQSLGTPLTTEELAMLVSFPSREVPGLRLKKVTDFYLNPPPPNEVILGNVLYRGEELLDSPISISLDSLSTHTFVSGITGAGKTNTCMVLLQAACKNETPFMVIEPAKSEYRSLLANPQISPPVQVFTLGNELLSAFRLNPFEFEEGFNLLTHIDLLRAVFNAAFPMYASMPYILEEAFMQVYKERGWDIVRSKNIHLARETGKPMDYRDFLPTLSDLFGQIDAVVKRKGYDERLTHDLTAALKARIQSLMQGGKGMMLDTQRSISFQNLLSRPVVLELQEIGDDDEKAFVMAMIFIRLYEYCRVHRNMASGRLQHLTLIEEAHRLLKNVSTNMSAEVANPRGKAVEMFADILAEVREYGEGFVIVDQIPSKLVPDVVKNTNLKIIHRLVARDDREFVGTAVGLNSEQIDHLVRMQRGEAVVHNGDMYLALMMQVADANKTQLKKTLQQNELELVQRSTADFRKSAGNDFRRWPVCSHCALPCQFLSESNRPGAAEFKLFQRYAAATLYSSPSTILKSWHAVLSETIRLLSARYPADEWEKDQNGILSCYFAQQVRNSSAMFFSYYRFHAHGGHRSLVELEKKSVEIANSLMADPSFLPLDELDAVREVFQKKIACAPLHPRPGCDGCQRQCLYGIYIQLHPQIQPRAKPHLAQMLNAELKELADLEQVKGDISRIKRVFSRVIAFSRRVTEREITVTPTELPHLGYCLFTNLTNNPQATRLFAEALRKNLVGS